MSRSDNVIFRLNRHRSSFSSKFDPLPQEDNGTKAHKRREEGDSIASFPPVAPPLSLPHSLREKTNCKKKKNRPTLLVARASSDAADDQFAHHSHPLSADDLGDWRAFRAALVISERGAGSPPTVGALSEPARAAARWAHAVSAPEKGCLLLAARPDLGPLFTQAVVLIVDHGERKRKGGSFLLLGRGEGEGQGAKERERTETAEKKEDFLPTSK